MKTYRLFFILLGAFSLVAIVASVTLGRPAAEDDNLVKALNRISNEIQNSFNDTEQLPRTMDEAKVPAQDQQGIEYRPTGNRRFELCATFKTSRKDDSMAFEDASVNSAYNHGKGRQCFRQEVYSPSR